MSIHRQAPRRDLVEPEIVEALKAAGCTIARLSAKGLPDLLVGSPDATLYLFEIKTGRGKLTDDEKRWIAAWNTPVYIVRDVETALKIIESSGLDYEWEQE